MSGLTTSWYHATNIALHAIACVLVTKVSLAVASLRPGFAALTGLLFAAHPVHTEAVSNCQVCNSRDEIIRKCTFYFIPFVPLSLKTKRCTITYETKYETYKPLNTIIQFFNHLIRR